jgi:Tfp pilus assembly protein PilP
MMQATRLLVLAALAVVGGVGPGWGGQQPAKSSPPSAKTAQTPAPKSAKATTAKSAKPPAEHKSTTESASAGMLGVGKRDPFKLPETAGGKGGADNIMEMGVEPGTVLPPGERGLLISQLKLEGVVREQTENKMIAVVTNQTKRAYFLRENQSVYNGVVSKITPDSVTFKENVLDENGHVTTREVVMRLNPAPGEGR